MTETSARTEKTKNELQCEEKLTKFHRYRAEHIPVMSDTP